jgi:DNA-binding MarR family transcriptional regulator
MRIQGPRMQRRRNGCPRPSPLWRARSMRYTAGRNTNRGFASLRKKAASKPRGADDTDAVSGDQSRCTNTALRKATRRVTQLYDTVLAPSGLRATQRSILGQVLRLRNPTLGRLAASLVLDQSALGHNLKPLMRDGFVVLDVDPDDRRNRLVKLTKIGESKFHESADLWKSAQDRFESKFGIVKTRMLRQTLDLISRETFDLFEAPKRRPKSTKE